MPKCALCGVNNLYSDIDVYTVKEDVDQYRKPKPTGKKRHRICRRCINNVEEKESKVTLHIVAAYMSKTNIVDPLKTIVAKQYNKFMKNNKGSLKYFDNN